ncbi:MAG: flagellar basal-body MS-ring/collar protein FliF [Gammaproteobacteria bacterium]
MATQTDEAPSGPLAALLQNAAARQLIAMVAIAASVALGVAVILWTRAPSEKVLFSNLSTEAAAEVDQALRTVGIEPRIDSATGSVYVPAAELDRARLSVASEGVPSEGGTGYRMLDEEPQFGVSTFIEQARYRRAVETEIARTIAKLKPVRSARVHLAQGNDSVFMRDRTMPTASVFLTVKAGRKLGEDMISSIVHTVASSTKDLQPQAVTVVDQFGNLLNSPDDNSRSKATDWQLKHKRTIEADYVRRVEELIASMVGFGHVRAEINAELDFTQSEQTAQAFNPATSAVRSENTSSSERRGGATGEGGVPGALTNQPPVTGADTAADAGENAPPPVDVSSNETRNFDVGTAITTTRAPVGTITRLSIAVVVDNIKSMDENEEMVITPRSPEELAQIADLVREAVGFDDARGDSIQVVNANFQMMDTASDVQPLAFWMQPWFIDLVRQALGLLLVLVVVFKVLKPVATNLIKASTAALPSPEQLALLNGGALALENNAIEGEIEQPVPPPPPTLEERMALAKQIAGEDPERVAKIMKEWVGDDDGG